MKDIAREAGVSTSLVSFVMCNAFSGGNYRVHPETAKKVLEIARRMNYHPNITAKSLKTGRTNTIGVILSDISNPFFAEIARIIENESSKQGYSVLFGSTDEDPRRLSQLVDVFRNKGVDGLVVVPCADSDIFVPSLKQSGVPVVFIDRTVEGTGFSSVLLDNREASRRLTSSLVARGCCKIEMVSYSLGLSNMSDREGGYLDAMELSGLRDVAKIHRVDFHSYRDEMDGIIRGARERGVDGLLFATNMLAICGMARIYSMGLDIPGDFALACFDRNDAFDVYPSDVLYVRQPLDGFARESTRVLFSLIEGGSFSPEESSLVLEPEIVESKIR